MRIGMQQSSTAAGLDHAQWQVGLVGSAVDGRGRAAIEFAQMHCNVVRKVRYDPERMKMFVDGDALEVDDIGRRINDGGSVLIEATTLGFAEILLLSKALQVKEARHMDFVYLEPKKYRDADRRDVLHRREFELSDSVQGYIGIPGSMTLLRTNLRQRGYFFLGFEQERLDRALEDFPIDAKLVQVAFGIPAFKPGWEMDSIANNLSVMVEKNISGGVHYCAADSPLAAYNLLQDAFDGLNENERLFVAPIGTKPNGIGAALFLSEHPSVGLIYDHPRLSSERSSDIEKWNLFSCVSK